MGEITSQIMNYDKVEEYFGWKPKTAFEKGLDITINWYREYLEKFKT